jgi:hypothetical protein
MACTVLRNSPRNKTSFGWVLVLDGSQMHARLAVYSYSALSLARKESKRCDFQATAWKTIIVAHMKVLPIIFCVGK